MKIDSNNAANLATLDSKKITDKSSFAIKKHTNLTNRYIDNGYSIIQTRELNDNIGILQIANRTLNDILNSNSISEIMSKLSNAKLFNKHIFSPSQMIRDEDGNTIFNANKILDTLPDNDKDIAIFKKTLKVEVKNIEDYLKSLKEKYAKIEDDKFEKDFLLSNSSLFAKSHNVASLASKIDALLA